MKRCPKCRAVNEEGVERCPFCNSVVGAPPASAGDTRVTERRPAPAKEKSGTPKIVGLAAATGVLGLFLGFVIGRMWPDSKKTEAHTEAKSERKPDEPAKKTGEPERDYAEGMKEGQAREKAKELARAKAAYEKALVAKPKDSAATGRIRAIEAELSYSDAMKRGGEYEKAEEWAKAKGEYEKALAAKPGDARAGARRRDVETRIAFLKEETRKVVAGAFQFKAGTRWDYERSVNSKRGADVVWTVTAVADGKTRIESREEGPEGKKKTYVLFVQEGLVMWGPTPREALPIYKLGSKEGDTWDGVATYMGNPEVAVPAGTYPKAAHVRIAGGMDFYVVPEVGIVKMDLTGTDSLKLKKFTPAKS